MSFIIFVEFLYFVHMDVTSYGSSIRQMEHNQDTCLNYSPVDSCCRHACSVGYDVTTEKVVCFIFRNYLSGEYYTHNKKIRGKFIKNNTMLIRTVCMSLLN